MNKIRNIKAFCNCGACDKNEQVCLEGVIVQATAVKPEAIEILNNINIISSTSQGIDIITKDALIYSINDDMFKDIQFDYTSNNQNKSR